MTNPTKTDKIFRKMSKIRGEKLAWGDQMMQLQVYGSPAINTLYPRDTLPDRIPMESIFRTPFPIRVIFTFQNPSISSPFTPTSPTAKWSRVSFKAFKSINRNFKLFSTPEASNLFCRFIRSYTKLMSLTKNCTSGSPQFFCNFIDRHSKISFQENNIFKLPPLTSEPLTFTGTLRRAKFISNTMFCLKLLTAVSTSLYHKLISPFLLQYFNDGMSTKVVGDARDVDTKVFEIHPFLKYWR